MHGQAVRHEVGAGLLADAPRPEADVVLGVLATGHPEVRLAVRLPTAWRNGRPALRSRTADGYLEPEARPAVSGRRPARRTRPGGAGWK